MDFGELKNDTDFVAKATNLQNALDKIEERISTVCDFPNYDDLSTEEKVKYDLFLSYSINSLYWMLCKLQAIEPGMVSVFWNCRPWRLEMLGANERDSVGHTFIIESQSVESVIIIRIGAQ